MGSLGLQGQGGRLLFQACLGASFILLPFREPGGLGEAGPRPGQSELCIPLAMVIDSVWAVTKLSQWE